MMNDRLSFRNKELHDELELNRSAAAEAVRLLQVENERLTMELKK